MTPKFQLAAFFFLQVLTLAVHCGTIPKPIVNTHDPKKSQHLVSFMLPEIDNVVYVGIHTETGKMIVYQAFEKNHVIESEDAEAAFTGKTGELYLTDEQTMLYRNRKNIAGGLIYDALKPSKSITIRQAQQNFDKKSQLEDKNIYGGRGPRVLTKVGDVQKVVVGDQGTFTGFAIEYSNPSTLKSNESVLGTN